MQLNTKSYLKLFSLIIIVFFIASCKLSNNKVINVEMKKNYLNFSSLPDLFEEDVIFTSAINRNKIYIATIPRQIGMKEPDICNFFAYDLVTGKTIWMNKYKNNSKFFSPDIEILFEKDKLYASTTESIKNKGVIDFIDFITCFNSIDGKEIFKTPIDITNKPSIYLDYLIVGSQIRDKTNQGKDFSFNMINSLSGKVEFSYKINSKWTGAPAIYKNFCAIVTDDRSVYFFDLEKRRFISKQTNRSLDCDPFPYDSSPVVFNDLVFSINGNDGLVLVAYYIETGNIAWSRDRFTLDNKEYDLSCEQPFVYKDSLICHANIPSNILLWIDPKSGILKKTSKITYPNFENMIITSGYYRSLLDGNKLYLFDDYGNNFPDIPIIKDDVFGYPNTLFCFNLDDDHLEFITEIAVDGYYYNIKSVDKDTLYLETASCLYLIDKFNGNYKDFLFFKDGKVISKYDEIMKYSEKKLSEKAK